MTTAPSTSFTIPTENELRRLLALRKPEDIPTLLALLENPLPDVRESIISLLVLIAKDAQSLQTRLVDTFVKATVTLLGTVAVCLVAFVMKNGALVGITVMGMGVTWSLLLNAAAFGPEKLRVANHAVFLLARINDPRAVPLLAEIWTPYPLTAKGATFNADVSRQLELLLIERGGKRFDRATEKALRDLVDKALFNGGLVESVFRLRPARDLAETDMDLLLSVVRHLSQPYARRDPRTAEPTADTATLQQVADISAPGTNYNLLRDTTQALLKQRVPI